MPTLLSMGYFITLIKETLPTSELHDAITSVVYKHGDLLSSSSWITLSPKTNPKFNSALIETEDQRQVEILSRAFKGVSVWRHFSLKSIFHVLCWIYSDTRNPSARREASMLGIAQGKPPLKERNSNSL